MSGGKTGPGSVRQNGFLWCSRHECVVKESRWVATQLETAQINVASRIDSRQHVPQRCALSKRISFRHCEKQGVSVFHGCQYLPVSLFCSLVLYLAPLNYCISLFTSAHAGIASNHARSCYSVIPLSLVRPPLVFMLLISTCSIIRSVDKPAHARSLLLATCGPATKC